MMALTEVSDLIDELVEASPEELTALVVDDAGDARAHYGVLRLESSSDIQIVASLKRQLPTPHLFILGIVDPEADELVTEAYGYGLNACITDPGSPEKLENRVREATRIVLDTVTL